MVSDGFLTCTKYMGGEIWLPDMHVIVLANFKPNVEALSLDRWNINKINKEGLALVRPRNINNMGRRGFNMIAPLTPPSAESCVPSASENEIEIDPDSF